MRLKPVVLIFAGPQGSGKGTQATLLAKQFQLPLAVAGDLFRSIAKEPTETGKAIHETLSQGKLMTNELWREVTGKYLEQADLSRGIILDGFIRNMNQVESFEEISAQQTLPPVLIIYLALPREQSIERLLKRGRHDDTMEAIERRLEWSKTDSEPAIEYYREKNQVLDINGHQSIDEVHDEIVAKLTNGGWVEN